MSLSLKAELEIWAAALKAYDEQDFEKALDLFSRIADSSKILTNMGLIYATIGEHETAVEHFIAATNLDTYLAIAHFQCGVSNFLLQRYDLALLNFEDAYLYLRGNEAINYDQLGLKFKLFSAEVMFNKGLAQINMGYTEEGMSDMQEATKLKITDEHSVIDDAIRDRGEGYTVFSIPVGVLYRPSENKLKNAKTKDYLGKAKLVAASDSNDAFTEFSGVMKRQQASAENADNKEDGKAAETPALSRSATVPTPRTDPIAPRPPVLERSKTTLQLGSIVRPDPAALASRRSQSVSNPANVPRPIGSDLSRTNTLARTNTTRLARSGTTNAGMMPLRAKAPQNTTGIVTGSAVADPRSGETRVATGGPQMVLRTQPSLRRLKEQEVPPVMQQSPPLPPPITFPPPPLAIQPGQYVNASRSATPLVLPAAPGPVQEGHLTQFYSTYMDVYTDDQVMRTAIARPPVIQQSSVPSPQRSPASSPFYQQPQPQSQEQQLPSWMQSAPSPAKTSSNASTGSGMSRAPSRAANATMVTGMNQNVSMEPPMSKGGINNASSASLRRKVSRRPTTRRVPAYEEEDGDDGFVTGEYEEYEMANVRVKLHYQGDVRGMTIPPATSFNEFVERVTAKFGTSLMGLGMKFTDEDGTKISLRDEGDFELAIETARESTKGRSEGKIEVWCVDV